MDAGADGFVGPAQQALSPPSMPLRQRGVSSHERLHGKAGGSLGNSGRARLQAPWLLTVHEREAFG